MTHSHLSLKRVVALLIASLVFAGVTFAQAPKKNYSLPAGDAAVTLKEFSGQSGEQIVYPADSVRGVQTKAVSGDLTARAALEKMLDGTGLAVVTDEKTGAFAIRVPAPLTKSAAAGSEAGSSAAKGVRVPTPAEVTKSTDGENTPVQLSPFEVNSSNDKGYAATSSMSGTRLNSKIEDIAASLSVVTKQQLQDTASVDINDVFLYETNTEGTAQWTSFVNDRGTISDDIQANPTGATRMRGLTAANMAVDGFTSSFPFDTYNVDSIEISRGPNSSIFGLGNTGGGVNAISSRANVSRDITSIGTRGDSYGGYRGNFDINRRLIKDKLAIRVLGLYDDKGSERKPSSDITRRLEVALTARPFKNTTLRASFESYREFYNRPNSTTPRDGISDWIASGKPTYDPITQTVHFGNGSPAISGLTTSALEAALLPYGIAATDTSFTTYPSMYIENGKIQLYEINQLPTATGTGPTSVNASGLHLLTSGTYYTKFSTQFPLYVTKGITDKSIYDWTSINITAPNYGTTKGETSTLNFEQIILNSPRQHLSLQASWQGERKADNSRSFLGTYGNAGGKLQVSIDINEKLLDGTPNPYFLRPYLGYPRPGFSKGYSDTDRYRTTLAYELNLTNEKGWIKWLGRHNLAGYGEFNSYRTANLGYTDTLSSDESWISATGVASSRNSAGYRPYVHYLLGDANGYNVDYGAKGIAAPPYSTVLRYYNGVTQQWVNEPVDYAEYYYANRPNRRLLSTYGGTWQGFFLNDRIVPTFGVRKDYNRTRDANSAINPTTATDGFYTVQDPPVYASNDWVKNRGKTTSSGVVVKPLSWLHLLYNQSDSFTPGSLAYDIYGQPLNDPKGKTKDYGFQFFFFNNRLSIRAQQYETIDSGRGDSTVNTYVQRTLRMDYFTSATDPNLTGFLTTELQAKNPNWTSDQVLAEVIKESGVDPTFIASHIGKTHGDNSTATSRGKEVEITFNPTKYWTMKSTVTQSRAFNGTLSAEIQQYIDARLPIWTTIKGPNSGNLWWTTPISGTTPQTFYTANVLAPLSLLTATQGKQRTQTREYRFNFVTNYQLAGITDNKWLKNFNIGGALRWEGRASLGYYGAAPDPDGIVRNYDPNRPIWDKDRYYVDFLSGYNLRFFQNRVHARIQLNVRNVFENGRLQTVGVNPDATPYAFRIIDPRQFILSANFDL
jgi:TonB-dependent Receptor Plug Domain